MDKHYGQIVEYVVRKTGYSISDLARVTHVNRRSVYNWFASKHLKSAIIYRIGHVIKHDFSKEFPELFISADFQTIFKTKQSFVSQVSGTVIDENETFKNKYISLLEKYNELLLDQGMDSK